MSKKAAAYIGALSAKQRKRLVRLAKTNDHHLSNIRAGARIGVDLAARLEQASFTMFGEDTSAPEPLQRQEMCDVCRRCPHTN